MAEKYSFGEVDMFNLWKMMNIRQGRFTTKTSRMRWLSVHRRGMVGLQNLVESRVIWQGLLDYGRLEWQKTVKRQPDQEIKILENFDIV